ncbi:DUF447 domain-containing protein [Thermococcus sp.]|uniref:DUF447 domain-containing protein n=1 Tax=Thermococcus sp. TaxID=35749 RepID=UPI00260A6554|nr:DUF447 domain-containing protein [Thermococcus sp.]
MLGNLQEGQIYEVLLVTSTNITPVGVVRRGNVLEFKLFPGRSFRDLLENPLASVQVTNDVELIVRLALNLPAGINVLNGEKGRWIKGLPGWYGRVEHRVEKWKDRIGEAEVLLGKFLPEGKIEGSLEPVPISRADCYLLEMAVHFTRFLVSRDPGMAARVLELHREYRRLGGSSEVADYIVERIEEGV